MPKTRLVTIGTGGHRPSVAEAAELSGAFDVIGFLDDALPVGKTVLNVSVLGAIVGLRNVYHSDSYRAACDPAIVALGNNTMLEKLMQHLCDAGSVWPPSFNHSLLCCQVH